MNSSRTPITIRPASAADARALWRLAALDSAPAPVAGPDVLIAEVGDRAVAALAGDRAIADPFLSTAPLVEMLRVQARQERTAEPARAPQPRRARAAVAHRPLIQS